MGEAIPQVRSKDDILTALDRACKKLKHDVELLARAIEERDLHTADMLAATVISGTTYIRQQVRQLLYGGV